MWRIAVHGGIQLISLFQPSTSVCTAVGASASVLAIVAATAYREPNYRIQLFLFGSVRLKYLALVVIGIDVLSITSSNAGGHIAHLGGALAGLWFAASLDKGKDLTAWLNRFLDGFISLLSEKTWKRKPKMKVHYGEAKNGREKEYDYNARKKAQSDEIVQHSGQTQKIRLRKSHHRGKKELVRRKQKVTGWNISVKSSHI